MEKQLYTAMMLHVLAGWDGPPGTVNHIFAGISEKRNGKENAYLLLRKLLLATIIMVFGFHRLVSATLLKLS